MDAIAERLRVTRAVFGLAQGEFAAKADINANTYNQYEQAVRRPSIEHAIALAERYNITLDWIYRGEPSGLKHETFEAIRAIRQARGP